LLGQRTNLAVQIGRRLLERQQTTVREGDLFG
jgi:hypothetical protein